MNNMQPAGSLALLGIAGFAAGWIAKGCLDRKAGGHVPGLRDFTTYSDDTGSHMVIHFTNGDEMTIDAETMTD